MGNIPIDKSTSTTTKTKTPAKEGVNSIHARALDLAQQPPIKFPPQILLVHHIPPPLDLVPSTPKKHIVFYSDRARRVPREIQRSKNSRKGKNNVPVGFIVGGKNGEIVGSSGGKES